MQIFQQREIGHKFKQCVKQYDTNIVNLYNKVILFSLKAVIAFIYLMMQDGDATPIGVDSRIGKRRKKYKVSGVC